MPSVTVTIPDVMKSEMEKMSWVNWSKLAQEILEKKLKTAELLRHAESLDEKEFSEWAAALVKKGRKGIFKELKSQGRG